MGGISNFKDKDIVLEKKCRPIMTGHIVPSHSLT